MFLIILCKVLFLNPVEVALPTVLNLTLVVQLNIFIKKNYTVHIIYYRCFTLYKIK